MGLHTFIGQYPYAPVSRDIIPAFFLLFSSFTSELELFIGLITKV